MTGVWVGDLGTGSDVLIVYCDPYSTYWIPGIEFYSALLPVWVRFVESGPVVPPSEKKWVEAR